MKALDVKQMERIEGGEDGFWAGTTCTIAVVGIAAAYTNPVSGTLASMALGTFLGSSIGSCLGFLKTGK